MAARGVFLLFFLLLFSGSSTYSFAGTSAQNDLQHVLLFDFEFEEQFQDLSPAGAIFNKLNLSKGHTVIAVKNQVLFISFRSSPGGDYLKRSKEIDPSHGVSDIIFPFHVFL